MEQEQKQPAYFKALFILFIALLGGQCLFLLIVAGLSFGGVLIGDAFADKLFIYLVPGLLFAAIFYAASIYKKNLPEIAANMNLKEKMEKYRELFIKRLAIVEGAIIFSIICFFISGNKLLGGCALAGIIFFTTLRPTKEKVIEDLQLSSTEVEEMERGI